jgi:hypothetical protein
MQETGRSPGRDPCGIKSFGFPAHFLLCAALVVALLAPPAASAAPGDPACAADRTLAPSFKFAEGERNVPLVATHELRVVANWSGDVLHPSLSVPEGVRVLGRKPRELRLIVPVSASLAVAASWEQASDPSDPGSDPSDPATRCVATQTIALPVTAAKPSRGYYDLGTSGSDGYSLFAAVPDQKEGDVSPLEVSVRISTAARFPSAGSKARKMPVAMRPSERVRYAKRIPNSDLLTSPERCRYYSLSCGPARVSTEVNALGERPLSRIRKRNVLSGPLLSRLQPYRQVAPNGVLISAFVSSQPGHEPPAVGYDIQVRQSGLLVARIRRAARCGKVPNGFGERFYRCHVVRRKNG